MLPDTNQLYTRIIFVMNFYILITKSYALFLSITNFLVVVYFKRFINQTISHYDSKII